MENLAKLTETDINNGVLNRMLVNAGIADVHEYVEKFHQDTEALIIEEFEHPDPNKTDNNEQIIPPGDVQNWITSLRLHLDDPNPASVPEPQQLPKRNIPTDVKSWMQHMTPIGLHSSNEINTNVIPDTTITNDALSGNLSTWLTDWSKNLTEQPPPTSLDNWLKRLVPDDLHEPLTKANTAKGRLNTYLNAAQQVLSQHGYDVSTQAKPSSSSAANVQVKSGKFGNVKQMYFLWKVLDKNNDRKITVEDIEIMLEEMGLNFVSKYVAKALFEMVDTDHDGVLQFRDFVALMGILKELIGAMGSAKA
ncbi:hypothetical protein I4U23_008163 [Adineta vaga]|nr:hypothetical protein I4U23_008163 [Adineta vaga]